MTIKRMTKRSKGELTIKMELRDKGKEGAKKEEERRDEKEKKERESGDRAMKERERKKE